MTAARSSARTQQRLRVNVRPHSSTTVMVSHAGFCARGASPLQIRTRSTNVPTVDSRVVTARAAFSTPTSPQATTMPTNKGAAPRGSPRRSETLLLHASDARTRFRCTASPGTDFGEISDAIDDAVAGGLALAGAMLVRASLPRARTPLEPLGPRASARATRERWQVFP